MYYTSVPERFPVTSVPERWYIIKFLFTYGKPSSFTCFTHHGGQQFGDDGASFPHFALFTVREVGNDSDNVPCTRGPAGIHHNEQLHDGRINIPVRKKEKTIKALKTAAGFHPLLYNDNLIILQYRKPAIPPSFKWAAKNRF